MKYLDKTSAIGENTADNRFDSSNVVSNRDGSLLERTEYLVQQSNPLADYILIDKDVFDVADADANNERWNVGYITGTEGGSADINTTTSGKLMVLMDPDASPTEARYAVNKALAVMGDVWKMTIDLDITWGTMGTTGCATGILLSKTTTYDATNYMLFQRAKTSAANQLTFSGKLNNSPISDVTPITLADDALALKIERWGEVYRFYYSTTKNPDETWVLFTEVEDASNYMTNQIGIFLEVYSKGSTTAETVKADIDNFQLFAGAGGGLIELAGDYDSTWATVNKDGDVFERMEGTKSDLAVIEAVQDSDMVVLRADITIVASDVEMIQSDLSDVQSDVTIILSDLKVLDAANDSDMVVLRADIASIASNLVADVQSDLNVVLSNLIADIQSDLDSLASDIVAVTNSDIVVIQSDLTAARTAIQSDLTVIMSNLVADIQSDINSLSSDIVAITNSDIVVIQSDLLVAKDKIVSDIATLSSDIVATTNSDIVAIQSNLTVLDAATDSDMVVLVATLSDLESDLTAIETDTVSIASDVVIVQSDLKALHSYGTHFALKSVVYDGSASYSAFAVTGCVAVKCVGYVTEALTSHADNTSVGTATSAAGLIVATAASAMGTIGYVWVDNAPSKFEAFPSAMSVIGNGEDIAVVGTVNITDGTVELYLFWIPLSSDGAVAAV